MDILCSRTARIVARLTQFYSEHASGDSFHSYEATPSSAAADHQLYRFLRKYEDPIRSVGVEADREARKSQLEAEALKDFLANEARLRGVSTTPMGSSSIGTVLMYAKARIRELLGPFDLKEYSASVDMTSGASTSRRRRHAHPVLKMKGRMHVTRNCALLAAHFLWDNEYIRWCMHERYGYGSVPADWFDIVPGSEQFSVVKQWDKVRLAAKEPDLNLLLQKGIGNMIRRRLKRVRIDLDDASYNTYLARSGSRTGSLATVDLSNASNNITLLLVRELLPEHWFRYIFTTRSPAMVCLDGEVRELTMASTMGNGFTFELESLLFWGLCKGVQEYLRISDRRLAVYGDDIVIHHEAVPLLSEVFESVGMQVNMEKTFASGPYRESCGGYYWLGHDIKGHYLRKEVKMLGDACKLANDVLDFCFRVKLDPPWKILRWLFKGEFNRIPPVVPWNYDERAGIRWWPVTGVTWMFHSQTYSFPALDRPLRKRQAVTRCRWALAVTYICGNLPGLVDPGYKPGHPRRKTLLYAEVGKKEVLRIVRDSSWEYPPYPLEWAPFPGIFH